MPELVIEPQVFDNLEQAVANEVVEAPADSTDDFQVSGQTDTDIAAKEIYSYTRPDGTVERAESEKDAIARCPFLGKLAIEQPQAASAMLRMAAQGRAIREERQKPQIVQKADPVFESKERPDITSKKTEQSIQQRAIQFEAARFMVERQLSEIQTGVVAEAVKISMPLAVKERVPTTNQSAVVRKKKMSEANLIVDAQPLSGLTTLDNIEHNEARTGKAPEPTDKTNADVSARSKLVKREITDAQTAGTSLETSDNEIADDRAPSFEADVILDNLPIDSEAVVTIEPEAIGKADLPQTITGETEVTSIDDERTAFALPVEIDTAIAETVQADTDKTIVVEDIIVRLSEIVEQIRQIQAQPESIDSISRLRNFETECHDQLVELLRTVNRDWDEQTIERYMTIMLSEPDLIRITDKFEVTLKHDDGTHESKTGLPQSAQQFFKSVSDSLERLLGRFVIVTASSMPEVW